MHTDEPPTEPAPPRVTGGGPGSGWRGRNWRDGQWREDQAADDPARGSQSGDGERRDGQWREDQSRGGQSRGGQWGGGRGHRGPARDGQWRGGWAGREWRGRDGRREPRPPRPVLFAPVFFAAIQVIGCTLGGRNQPDATALDGLGYLLLLIGPAALLLRRRWPLVAAAIGLLATTGYLMLGYPGGPFFLAGLLALFGAVRRSNRYAVWTVAALAYAPYLVLALVPGRLIVDGHRLAQPTLGQVLVVGAGLSVVLALADAARVRGAQFAERARAQAESERARREQTRRQASDERLRIARELHDVLGHHLSLINVRAGVGLHLLDSQPDEARAALTAIKVASAEALHEVRGVLAALNPETDAAPRSPAPGLADVDGLAADARAAGLPVSVQRHGPAVALPATVDRAAYRIVQEALTNVRRHAGPAAQATVDITYGGTVLNLRVEDTGTPAAPAPARDDGGNGIPGMRERAAALGGSLTAGPRPGAGFRVDAVLPVPSPSTREYE